MPAAPAQLRPTRSTVSGCTLKAACGQELPAGKKNLRAKETYSLKKHTTGAKALLFLAAYFRGLKPAVPRLKPGAGTLVVGVVCGVALSFSSGSAQNIEGQIIASEYGTWTVPGYTSNAYSFAPGSCRVQGGASFFFAFNTGTPVRIVDANPALSETVTPTSYVDTNVTCAIAIAPVNSHQTPFHLTSATGGLQEALSQNLTTPATNTIILNNAWYIQVAAVGGNPATVIATVQGSANLGLVDVTQVPTVWYQWNGSQYVKVSLTGTAGDLGTLQSDLVANNQTNTDAVDLYDFVATAPTSGVSTYSPQAAVNAAAANNGSAIIQPGAGRTPFTNPGNYRVQDNRADVPATCTHRLQKMARCATCARSTGI